MKRVTFIVLALSISACCGTNRAAENPGTEDSKVIAQADSPSKSVATEPIEILEIPDPESKAKEEVEAVKIEEPNETSASEVMNDEVEITTYNKAFDHGIWDNLLQKHVSNSGTVNYKGFRSDKKEFLKYLRLLSDNAPQESWSDDETLAYWMNVYNAFTIKLILDNYPTKSIKDIKGPWSHRFIRIGDKWYTLNDVEHRIIRKMDEPRIHFALVCAAVSCPRLYNKAFTAERLDEDLSMLTRGFLSDPSKNKISENSIELSKIFKWYGGDFKSNGSTLIDFLNQYSDVTISSSAKKSFKDYNWALNE